MLQYGLSRATGEFSLLDFLQSASLPSFDLAAYPGNIHLRDHGLVNQLV